MSKLNRQQIPIAVVGVSALFPGSTDSRGFWNDILAGKDRITDVPASHWLIDDYYDPDPKALDAAKALGAPVVELHTGAYCETYNHDASDPRVKRELDRIVTALSLIHISEPTRPY